MENTLDDLEAQDLQQKIRLHAAEAEKAEMEVRLIKGQGVANGEFVFIGQVNETNCHLLIDRLDMWSRLHPDAPLRLLINSEGGNVYDGHALYDFLRLLRKRGHHITTVGTGLVASMAGLILQAGDERTLTPNAWLLVHEIQIIPGQGQQFSASTLDDQDKQVKRLQAQILDILSERSIWPKDKLRRYSKRKDAFLDAKEALAAGLIDRIEDFDASSEVS